MKKSKELKTKLTCFCERCGDKKIHLVDLSKVDEIMKMKKQAKQEVFDDVEITFAEVFGHSKRCMLFDNGNACICDYKTIKQTILKLKKKHLRGEQE